MLGLGLTALLASFMSGMAGNVTAFNTVWTYDIYQSHIRRGASDAHYLWMGRVGDRRRDRAVGGRGLRGRRVQQHHGPAAARLRVRQRAAVRHLRARACSGGARTGHGAFCRPRCPARSARRCTTGSRWPRRAARGEGRLPRPAAHLPERAGADVLDGDRRVDHLLRRHHPREPRDPAARRRRSCADWSTRSRPGPATSDLPLGRTAVGAGGRRARADAWRSTSSSSRRRR